MLEKIIKFTLTKDSGIDRTHRMFEKQYENQNKSVTIIKSSLFKTLARLIVESGIYFKAIIVPLFANLLTNGL